MEFGNPVQYGIVQWIKIDPVVHKKMVGLKLVGYQIKLCHAYVTMLAKTNHVYASYIYVVKVLYYVPFLLKQII